MRAVIGKNGTVSTVERQRMWLEELNRKHILYFGCHTGLGKTCQAELLAEKKSLYSDYYKLKNEQRDLLIYKANIERIMQLDEEEKERSRQRQQEEK